MRLEYACPRCGEKLEDCGAMFFCPAEGEYLTDIEALAEAEDL